MKVFVLGAGASRHIGYPLTATLWKELQDYVKANRPTSREDWNMVQYAESISGFTADFEYLFTSLEKRFIGHSRA